MSGQDAARRFVDEYFPHCRVAIWCGSAAARMETERSDLDLVIIDDTRPQPFRAAYEAYGWPIEAFVLTSRTYGYFFEINALSGIPSLQRMCADGVVLKDDGLAASVIEEARESLRQGPAAWSEEERDAARFAITECLEDLAGSASLDEDVFIAHRLAALIVEFELRMHGCWLGEGKWLARSLRRHDEALLQRLLQALRAFHCGGGKAELIGLADRILAPHGGRLFAGFYQEG